MYAPVLVEWVSVLLRQRDEVTAQRDNAVDASKEGAWMARALDAERERDVAQAATVNAALIRADLVRERDEARADFANACDVGRRQEARAEKAERERDEARRDLGEILAVIHRDGGHYTGEHGISKSVADAHAAWAAVVRAREKAQAELAFLRKEYGEAESSTLFEAQRNQVEALKAENERLQRLLDHATQANPGTSTLVMLMNEASAVRAERDLLKNHYSPEAAAKLRAELASARAELAFLRKEYGEAESGALTRDALELKAQVLEASLLHVCKAASEITSWDFSHLLLEHPDAKTLLGDVAALEAALKQHGPERS
jgi:hypothetical protein